MNKHDVILNLHGRTEGIALAREFSRAVEDLFAPDDRTPPRFEQKRVRGERLLDAEGAASDELFEAFFGNIPHYHYSTLTYRVPLAGDRPWAHVALRIHRDPEDGDGDASLDFGVWEDWTDGPALTSGRILAAGDVETISSRVIEAIRPDTAYLFLAAEPSFAPSCFLRFHRDARFFASDVTRVLRIARDDDKEEGQQGFFEWMKEAARVLGETPAYDELVRVTTRAPLTDSEQSKVRVLDGLDVRTALAACRRTRSKETEAGVTVFADAPLRGFVDELYTALIRRSIGDPVASKRGGDDG